MGVSGSGDRRGRVGRRDVSDFRLGHCRCPGGCEAGALTMEADSTYCQGWFTVTGTACPGAFVTLTMGGIRAAVRADGLGNWSKAFGAFPPGDYTLTAEQTAGGPQETVSAAIRIAAANSVAIDVPSQEPPLDAVSGTAAPGAIVTVRASAQDGTRVQSTQADARGDWRVALNPPIAWGDVRIEATATLPPCPPATASVEIALPEPPPAGLTLTVTDLVMGGAFRTVDATYRYGADAELWGPGTIHYLLLKPGLPAPSAQEVVAYDDEATLTDGTAARGRFPAIFEGIRTQTRALPGREVPDPYPDETGVVDGYRYVLYMVAVRDEHSTGVSASSASALGMPFDYGLGDDAAPFGLREIAASEMDAWPDLRPGHPIHRTGVTETARMLDNIEGMVVLYLGTDGLYGMADTLGAAYDLETDFDLSGYADAFNGSGWRPIGNMNATRAGGFEHIFRGSMQSYGPRRLITGLTIDTVVHLTGIAISFVGLFGLAEGAVLAGFDLADASVSAEITPGFLGHVGALAGGFVGDLEGIGVTNAAVSASGTGLVDVGGLVGTLISMRCAGLTATGCACAVDAGADSAAGGIAGRLYNVEAGIAAVSGCAATGIAGQSSGAMGGLFGACVVSMAQGGIDLSDCAAQGGFTGNAYVGGLLGLLGGSPNRDPGICTVQNCEAAVDVRGHSYVGGFIGNAERATLRGIHITAGSVGDTSGVDLLTRPFGGLLGALREGSLYDCTAEIDVLVPRSSRAGGLVGDLTVSTTDYAFVMENCSATGDVAAVSYAGGLVGAYTTAQPVMSFVGCFAAGNVAGSAAAGATSAAGFIGSSQLAAYSDCYALGNVQGRTNVAGFIGDSAGESFAGCYARGNVGGAGTSVAGFVGSVSGSRFERCYCTGDVTASASNAGGFVSNFVGGSSITDCYATGDCQGTGNAAGLVQGLSGGSSITRCYASGFVSATAAAGGVVAAGSGTVPNPVSDCFALNPLVAAGGSSVVGRVAASAYMLALSNNAAIDTLVLTRGGATVAPTPGPNLKDGSTVTLPGLQAAMEAAGWSASVWNFGTIATLGRPILVAPAEG